MTASCWGSNWKPTFHLVLSGLDDLGEYWFCVLKNALHFGFVRCFLITAWGLGKNTTEVKRSRGVLSGACDISMTLTSIAWIMWWLPGFSTVNFCSSRSSVPWKSHQVEGNPLQCSCLQNPRDGGAWWAPIYGVTQSQTRLKLIIRGMQIKTTIRYQLTPIKMAIINKIYKQ